MAESGAKTVNTENVSILISRNLNAYFNTNVNVNDRTRDASNASSILIAKIECFSLNNLPFGVKSGQARGSVNRYRHAARLRRGKAGVRAEVCHIWPRFPLPTSSPTVSLLWGVG